MFAKNRHLNEEIRINSLKVFRWKEFTDFVVSFVFENFFSCAFIFLDKIFLEKNVNLVIFLCFCFCLFLKPNQNGWHVVSTFSLTRPFFSNQFIKKLLQNLSQWLFINSFCHPSHHFLATFLFPDTIASNYCKLDIFILKFCYIWICCDHLLFSG